MESLTIDEIKYYVDFFAVVSFLIAIIGFAYLIHKRVEEVDITDADDKELENIFNDME